MGTLHHLHRVTMLPVRTLDEIAREAEGQPDLYASIRDGVRFKQPLLDRISDALDSPLFLAFYLGSCFGCLLTAALAYCWSLAL